MCLNINKGDKVQVADKDIVIYKRLVKITHFKQLPMRCHGKRFTGVINHNKCSGIISINKGLRPITFFCTNNPNIDGRVADELFGRKYSWALDSSVSQIIVEGEEFTGKVLYYTPYQSKEIEIGKTYKSSLERYDISIHKGLHSFETLEDAKKDGINVYAKCIIPKGSKFFRGMFNGSISYASNRITYLKLVK